MQVLTDAMKGELLRAPAVKTVAHGTRLVEAPRYVLDAVLTWHAELRRERLTDVALLNGEEWLVWAEGWPDDSARGQHEVMGALLWTPQDDGSWWTELGYVAAAHRGAGVYRLLWNTVVWLAEVKGVRLIQGGTAHGNAIMHQVMLGLGRRPSFVVYDYDVEAGGD